ncbi:MAG: dihydropteroate synthase [Algisphaera sp.]
MGILNVTPDSFSDGGRFNETHAAVAHALNMARAGADVIDVGGESSRPGAKRIAVAQQIERTTETIRGCRAALDEAGFAKVVMSIDTTHAPVAQAALEAGATVLNDISAGEEDPAMLRLAAERNAPIILMHKQGPPATMQKAPHYQDVVAQVRDYLKGRVAAAKDAGVSQGLLAVDPGIGFGKTLDHNVALLAGLDVLVGDGTPVLLGASRKRFLAHLQGHPELSAEPDPAGGSAATTALAVAAGVRMIRVHDVALHRQAADTAWAIATLQK